MAQATRYLQTMIRVSDLEEDDEVLQTYSASRRPAQRQ